MAKKNIIWGPLWFVQKVVPIYPYSTGQYQAGATRPALGCTIYSLNSKLKHVFYEWFYYYSYFLIDFFIVVKQDKL